MHAFARPFLLAVLAVAAGCGSRAHAPVEPPAPAPPHFGGPANAEPARDAPRAQPSVAAVRPGAAAEIAISLGHACARTVDGEVWCWGGGQRPTGPRFEGRQGFEKTAERIELPARAAALDSESAHCAILVDGTVACWNANVTRSSSASLVAKRLPNLADIVAMNDDGVRAYFVRRDGTVFVQERNKPLAIVPSLAGAAEIVAHPDGHCARMRDKTLRCWTWATRTVKRGEPKRPPSTEPSPMVPTAITLAGVTTLDRACAIASGSVHCWGDNTGGQIGDGTTIARSKPVSPGVTNAVQVSRGSYVTCAVLADKTLRCWGDTNEYPLIPGAGRRVYPSPVAVPLTNVAEVRVGVGHACARLGDGRVACWGRNQFDEIGDGSKELERPTPSFVVGFGRNAPADDRPNGQSPASALQPLLATDISAGGDTTCARLQDGAPRCWGRNNDGQLGDGTREDRSRPVANPYVKNVSAIRTGSAHTCALDGADGSVTCWGSNVVGQLGVGTEDNHAIPVRVPGLTGVKQVAVGSITCALLGDGTVKCWGDYDHGHGDPGPSGSMGPTPVAGASGIVEIAAYSQGACGRGSAGDVRCFGFGPLHEITGGRTPQRQAFPVRGLARAKALAAGPSFCAVVEGGSVMCWGRGDVADVDRVQDRDGVYALFVPVRAKGFDRTLDVSIGDDGSCARNEARELTCWEDKKLTRPGLRDVVKVTQGRAHACALLASGEVHCWGNNDSGQLGDGTTTARTTPVRVAY